MTILDINDNGKPEPRHVCKQVRNASRQSWTNRLFNLLFMVLIKRARFSGQKALRSLHQGQSSTRPAAPFAQLKKLSDGDSENLAQKIRGISGVQNVSLAEAVR